MTTTRYGFTGNETQAVSFSPTLDSEVYNVAVHWNMPAQRWYFTITTTAGVRVATRPLVASPADTDIDLLFGLFDNTSMVWRQVDGNIEVTS